MRVRCAPGGQGRFIYAALRSSFLSLSDLAEIAGVSRPTLSSWHDDECNASLQGMQRIRAYTGVPLPVFLEIIDDAEMRSRRSRAAYATRERSGRPPGTPESRANGGRMSQRYRLLYPERYSGVIVPHAISVPDPCPELAEFVGIMLGDGGITKQQVTVSLNVHEEDWIFENIELVRACVRGLMNTDGCVFGHSYRVNGKMYSYVKLAFSSHSPRMLEDMRCMRQMLGFHPGTPRTDYIWLSRAKEVRAYHEQLVGMHNPYHQRRHDAARQKKERR